LIGDNEFVRTFQVRIAVSRTGSPSAQGTGKNKGYAMTQLETERTMTENGKVVYTAQTRTTGGRDGDSRSSDGHLDIRLSTPGSVRIGTNPEQLFAAGWSACLESAIGPAARRMKITLAADVAIDAEVDLNLADHGYQICPYSKATRGNIDVAINLV
jgi:osmotically inducible protein OsmC